MTGVINDVFNEFKKQSCGPCASETDVDELLDAIKQQLAEKINEFKVSRIACSDCGHHCVSVFNVKNWLLGEESK